MYFFEEPEKTYLLKYNYNYGITTTLSPSSFLFSNSLNFLLQVYQGNISRMRKMYSLPIISKAGSVLSLLVENQGRINYGSQLHDFKVS